MSCHKQNMFLTLTYSDDYLPAAHQDRHFVLFMKRLRKYFSPNKVKFFSVAEYGEEGNRSHWHSIIFGCNFSDLMLWEVHEDYNLYISQTLTDMWGMGHCTVGEVNAKSISYLLKYMTKEEDILIKKSGGLGRDAISIEEIKTYRSLCMNGHKFPIPRYYIKKIRELPGMELFFYDLPLRLEDVKRYAELGNQWYIKQKMHAKYKLIQWLKKRESKPENLLQRRRTNYLLQKALKI